MNVTSLKNPLSNNQSLWIAGILIGVYINILHTIPFMLSSEFFLIFILIALCAVTIPAVAVAWNQEEGNAPDKLRHIIKGMSVSSIAFILIYLAEIITTNDMLRNLTIPAKFPISRVPVISFLVTLIVTGLLIFSLIFYRSKTPNIGP
jgi:hypothetical protein